MPRNMSGTPLSGPVAPSKPGHDAPVPGSAAGPDSSGSGQAAGPDSPGPAAGPDSPGPGVAAAALRLLTVPDSAPPYDDEPAARTVLHDQAAPLDHQAARAVPRDHQPTRAPSAAAPGRASPATRTATGTWPSRFAQALAETLAGTRPARQLTPWTTDETRQRIRQLGPLLATGQRPRVRRVMTSSPSQDVLELTAVVGFGTRVRALALRLERAELPARHVGLAPGQPRVVWRCTAIESA